MESSHPGRYPSFLPEKRCSKFYNANRGEPPLIGSDFSQINFLVNVCKINLVLRSNLVVAPTGTILWPLINVPIFCNLIQTYLRYLVV